jgi:arylformamidase
MEIYDISQTLCSGIPVWPGDAEFGIRRTMCIREGGSTNVSAVGMGVHTGTHVDAPLHLDDAGSDIARVPLESFIGPARVLEIASERSIRALDLSDLDWTGVRRVLFKTRNSRSTDRQFQESYVYIENDAACFLAEQGMLLVGTDASSVDAFASTDLPSHHTLLRCGIIILEGARLGHVPPGDYELVCLPLKLSGSDGSPVRAILRR